MANQKPWFDPRRPFAEVRAIGKAQTVRQGGHEFSLRHEYIGPDPDWKKPKPVPSPVVEDRPPGLPPDNGRAGVLARAQQKLARFAEPEDLSETKKEDNRAKSAERLAI